MDEEHIEILQEEVDDIRDYISKLLRGQYDESAFNPYA